MRLLIIEDDRDAAAYLTKAFREAWSHVRSNREPQVQDLVSPNTFVNLGEDFVLIGRNQLAQHPGAQLGSEDRVCGAVAREGAVRHEALRYALCTRLVRRLAKRKSLGLGEEIGHQQVVVVTDPVSRPQETDEVRRD